MTEPLIQMTKRLFLSLMMTLSIHAAEWETLPSLPAPNGGCFSGAAGSKIIIVGRSVGGGPSVWLAERKTSAGLVLISPFTSVFAVRIPVPIFPRDRFPSLKRIPQVKCPLLVIHGEEDTLIPASHGRKLVAAATVADKEFLGIPSAGHNDLFEVGAGTIELAIRDFVIRVSPPQSAAGN